MGTDMNFVTELRNARTDYMCARKRDAYDYVVTNIELIKQQLLDEAFKGYLVTFWADSLFDFRHNADGHSTIDIDLVIEVLKATNEFTGIAITTVPVLTCKQIRFDWSESM